MKILWIFDQDVIWTLVPLVATLWGLGGSGPKLVRRLGVPAAISLYAYGYGISPWPLIVLSISTLGLIGFGPGYGDDYYAKLKALYWPYIFLLGAAYSLCQFGLVLHFGNLPLFGASALLTSGAFGGGMFLSKKLGLPWKVAEIATGAAIGLTGVLLMR